MTKHLVSNQHSIHNINYHLVLVTKYRKKLIEDNIELKLYDLIEKYGKVLNIDIIKINGLSNHIHIFFRCGTSIKIDEIVGKLKGYSSYMIRKLHKYLKRYKAFWSTGYFIESIGSISETAILAYIKNQKN